MFMMHLFNIAHDNILLFPMLSMSFFVYILFLVMMLKCPIILAPFLETNSLVASVIDEVIPWKKMQIPLNYL